MNLRVNSSTYIQRRKIIPNWRRPLAIMAVKIMRAMDGWAWIGEE
jgi:hypothetical protein